LNPSTIFPRRETYQRIVEIEVEEVGDAQGLQMLLEVAEDNPLLREAADKKLQMLSGNSISKSTTSDTAKLRVGNEYITQVDKPAASANRM
jgi:hypothetical protein